MGMVTGDRILEQTTTTGTGNITLTGAVTGYRAFSAVATVNGDMFPYVIAGASEWEVGIGTRVSSTTFSRSPTASSNAGALVNFSAGTKEVWIDWTNQFISNLAAVDNLIINGATEVSQEQGGTAQTGITGTNKYIVDIFAFVCTGAGAFTLQQVTDAPTGFKKSLKVTTTTADASLAATDRYIVTAFVEGYRAQGLGFGASGALSMSLGFWVKSHRTGTYTGGFANNGATRAYAFEYTVNVADTWEYKTVIISGDTTGTWDVTNGAHVYISWSLGHGSNFNYTAGSWQAGTTFQVGTSNQVNAVAATTDTFQITGVSLIPGVVPVPEAMLPYIVQPFDEELALCQRYYEKSYDYTSALGAVTSAGISEIYAEQLTSGTLKGGAHTTFRVRKRNIPTMTVYSPVTGTAGQLRDFATTAADITGTTSEVGEAAFFAWGTSNGSKAVLSFGWHWVADARL